MIVRQLLDGTYKPELRESVTLTVITKCPEKYTLIDNETGQVYTGTSNRTASKQWKMIKGSQARIDVEEILEAVDQLLKL